MTLGNKAFLQFSWPAGFENRDGLMHNLGNVPAKILHITWNFYYHLCVSWNLHNSICIQWDHVILGNKLADRLFSCLEIYILRALDHRELHSTLAFHVLHALTLKTGPWALGTKPQYHRMQTELQVKYMCMCMSVPGCVHIYNNSPAIKPS